jgi:hypothetical protein
MKPPVHGSESRSYPIVATKSAVRVQAHIEILKAESEILRRQLAAAETRAAQAVMTKRLDNRLDALAAERARPWWLRLVSG